MGNGGAHSATASLPKGPAERAPDDDGSFKRPVRRNDNNYMDQPPSRSEGDGNWRRGGAGTSSPGLSFSSGGGRMNYDNNRSSGFDRGGSSGFDQRGGFSRGSYADGGSSGNDGRTSGGDNWRGGSNTRESGLAAQSSTSGERPRLQLKSRTLPLASSGLSTTKSTSTDPIDDLKSSPERPAQITPSSSKEIEGNFSDNPIEGTNSKDEIEDTGEKPLISKSEPKEKIKREPDVINSRAAAFGGSSVTANTRSEVL